MEIFSEKLEAITKEELVKIIATMHDAIDDWDNGHGLSKIESSKLKEVGKLCVDHCTNTGEWL